MPVKYSFPMLSTSALVLLLTSPLFHGCKSSANSPSNRRLAYYKLKSNVVDQSIFASNRLEGSEKDDGAEVTSDKTEDDDVVSEDGGFIRDLTTGDKIGSTTGKIGEEPYPTTTPTPTPTPTSCEDNPTQSKLKGGGCNTSTPAPTATATATATPTTSGTATPLPTGATPTATATATPGKETCNQFVHLKGHKPEWTAVFIPAISIPSGTEDHIAVPPSVQHKIIPSCGFPKYPTCVKGGFTYTVMTNGQPGSPECPAVYGKNYSPLIIDMTGHGIQLTSPRDGIRFDITGDGTKIKISWPTHPENTPFLVYDKNGNGNIDSVHELFGDNTHGPDGKTAANGFAALAKYDGNGDKRITSKDAIWNDLRLWRDLNHDGIAQPKELSTLKQNRLTEIDLEYVSKVENGDYYGNNTQQRSVVSMRSGRQRPIFDLWFVPGVE